MLSAVAPAVSMPQRRVPAWKSLRNSGKLHGEHRTLEDRRIMRGARGRSEQTVMVHVLSARTAKTAGRFSTP